jgi:hypothetical protein
MPVAGSRASCGPLFGACALLTILVLGGLTSCNIECPEPWCSDVKAFALMVSIARVQHNSQKTVGYACSFEDLPTKFRNNPVLLAYRLSISCAIGNYKALLEPKACSWKERYIYELADGRLKRRLCERRDAVISNDSIDELLRVLRRW